MTKLFLSLSLLLLAGCGKFLDRLDDSPATDILNKPISYRISQISSKTSRVYFVALFPEAELVEIKSVPRERVRDADKYTYILEEKEPKYVRYTVTFINDSLDKLEVIRGESN